VAGAASGLVVSGEPVGRRLSCSELEGVEPRQELVPVDDVGVEFGPSMQACLRTILPSMVTGTMQAPHMPVASTMIEFRLDTVLTP